MEPDANDIIYDTYSLNIVAILRRLYEALGGTNFEDIFTFLEMAWNVYTVLALLLSAIFLFGIIYATIRLGQATELEERQIRNIERLYAEIYGKKGQKNVWEDIDRHIDSPNPNDWKLAIIEADIMLGKALDSRGYAGTSIGEQLKSISPSSLETLNDAWEAHKVRNQIAHDGADFVLTKKKAQDTIIQYKRVLTEFGEL